MNNIVSFEMFTVSEVTENDYQIVKCIVLLVFCHFLIWCFGPDVILDCINSQSFSSSYFKKREIIISDPI